MDKQKTTNIANIIRVSANLENARRDFNKAWREEKETVLQVLRSRKTYKQNYNYYLDNYKEEQLVDDFNDLKKLGIAAETQIGDIKKLSYELNGFPRYNEERKINLQAISEIKTMEELGDAKLEIEDLIFNVYSYLKDERNDVKKGTRAIINAVVFETLACIDVNTTLDLREVSGFAKVGKKAPTKTVKDLGKRSLPKDTILEKRILFWVEKRYEEVVAKVILEGVNTNENLIVTFNNNVIEQNEKSFAENVANKIFSNYEENRDEYRNTCSTPLQVVNKYYIGSKETIESVCEKHIKDNLVVENNLEKEKSKI